MDLDYKVQKLEGQIKELQRRLNLQTGALGRFVGQSGRVINTNPPRRFFAQITDVATVTYADSTTRNWYSWQRIGLDIPPAVGLSPNDQPYPAGFPIDGNPPYRSAPYKLANLETGLHNAVELNNVKLNIDDIVEVCESQLDDGIWYTVKSESASSILSKLCVVVSGGSVTEIHILNSDGTVTVVPTCSNVPCAALAAICPTIKAQYTVAVPALSASLSFAMASDDRDGSGASLDWFGNQCPSFFAGPNTLTYNSITCTWGVDLPPLAGRQRIDVDYTIAPSILLSLDSLNSRFTLIFSAGSLVNIVYKLATSSWSCLGSNVLTLSLSESYDDFDSNGNPLYGQLHGCTSGDTATSFGPSLWPNTVAINPV